MSIFNPSQKKESTRRTRRHQYILGIYTPLIVLLVTACQSSTHVDIEAVIEEKVQERLVEFKRIIDSRCREKMLDEAGLIADSVVLKRARLQKDTLQRPLRPLRPNAPLLKTLEDSLPLKPLFEPNSPKQASSTIGG